jgi:hypothetical protein
MLRSAVGGYACSGLPGSSLAFRESSIRRAASC